MNSALLMELISLRYRLLWANVRTRNGRLFLFVAGLMLFGLFAALKALLDGVACKRGLLFATSPRWNTFITMKAVHVNIRRIGNSQCVVIPKGVLAELGLSVEAGAEMTIEGGALVLRRRSSRARAGWAEAAKKIAEAGDDALVMDEFGDAADRDLVW
jgi:antitoxin MazE